MLFLTLISIFAVILRSDCTIDEAFLVKLAKLSLSAYLLSPVPSLLAGILPFPVHFHDDSLRLLHYG